MERGTYTLRHGPKHPDRFGYTLDDFYPEMAKGKAPKRSSQPKLPSITSKKKKIQKQKIKKQKKKARNPKLGKDKIKKSKIKKAVTPVPKPKVGLSLRPIASAGSTVKHSYGTRSRIAASGKLLNNTLVKPKKRNVRKPNQWKLRKAKTPLTHAKPLHEPPSDVILSTHAAASQVAPDRGAAAALPELIAQQHTQKTIEPGPINKCQAIALKNPVTVVDGSGTVAMNDQGLSKYGPSSGQGVIVEAPSGWELELWTVLVGIEQTRRQADASQNQRIEKRSASCPGPLHLDRVPVLEILDTAHLASTTDESDEQPVTDPLALTNVEEEQSMPPSGPSALTNGEVGEQPMAGSELNIIAATESNRSERVAAWLLDESSQETMEFLPDSEEANIRARALRGSYGISPGRGQKSERTEYESDSSAEMLERESFDPAEVGKNKGELSSDDCSVTDTDTE